MPTTYYQIQYSDFATNSSYINYYATWSYGSAVTWSTTAPTTAPDNTTTFAVGITTSSGAPGAITVLGDGGKELPPPPNMFSGSVKDLQDFKDAFDDWQAKRAP